MVDALLVTSSFLPGRGGIESYLARLCEDLRPRLAVLAPPARDGRPLPRDVPYITIPGPGRMLTPDRRLVEAIEQAAARVGTRRILFGTPWPVSLVGPALSRRGFRYATIVHGAEMLVPSVVPAVRAPLRRSLEGADLLLPVSEFTAEKLRSFVRTEVALELLRARVDLERYRPDRDTNGARAFASVSEDERVVLHLGRLVPRKGVDRLIDSWPQIRNRIPDARLVIGGTGPAATRLRRRADAAAVTFTGRVPDDIAPGLYALADAFVLPVADRYRGLDTEGLGVVLLEAAASGTPCVTGRSGGTPEAVVDGETGFVVDARDRTRLAEAIVTLLADRDRAREMGRAGRRHVETNFAAGTPPPRRLAGWLGGHAEFRG